MRQCTAVGGERQFTFDPRPPGAVISTTLDGNLMPSGAAALTAVACPSVSQCTAVDNFGNEITFDPRARADGVPVSINRYSQLWGIACPAARQCTAAGAHGRVFTFDPTRPATATATVVGPPEFPLVPVACPSSRQCTVVGRDGREVTFDPVSPGARTRARVVGNDEVDAVACPSARRCTAIGLDGRVVTFAPRPPVRAISTTVHAGEGVPLTAVACPSVGACAAVDTAGDEVKVDPTTPVRSTRTTLDCEFEIHAGCVGKTLSALACPSTRRCTAVDNFGQQVTFDPISLPRATSTPAPTMISVAR